MVPQFMLVITMNWFLHDNNKHYYYVNKLWDYPEEGSDVYSIVACELETRVDCNSNAIPVSTTTAGKAKQTDSLIREGANKKSNTK